MHIKINKIFSIFFLIQNKTHVSLNILYNQINFFQHKEYLEKINSKIENVLECV